MSKESPKALATELGKIMRSLRNDAAITGVELGERAGLSQSKISKFELGHAPLPETAVILKMLDILEAPKPIRREVQLLLIKLDASQSTSHQYHFSYLHGRYLELERSAATVQVVTYGNIPALLQTAAYREALLKTYSFEGNELASAMRETNLRQDNIWNKAVYFEFLITEASLYTITATAQVQLAQLDKLERYLDLPNVEIGIIPAIAGLHAWDACNFIMYDKQILLRSLGNLEVESRDTETALEYAQLVEELGLKAQYGPDAAKLIAKASMHIAASDGLK